MLWQCPALQDTSLICEQDWDEVITSSEFKHQSEAVQRARERAERLGLPIPTWEQPAANRRPQGVLRLVPQDLNRVQCLSVTDTLKTPRTHCETPNKTISNASAN